MCSGQGNSGCWHAKTTSTSAAALSADLQPRSPHRRSLGLPRRRLDKSDRLRPADRDMLLATVKHNVDALTCNFAVIYLMKIQYTPQSVTAVDFLIAGWA